MRHRTCKQALTVEGIRLHVRIECLDMHLHRSRDDALLARYGQAALVTGLGLVADRGHRRIDADIALTITDVDDEQLTKNADLRCRKTHAVRRIHGFKHIVDEVGGTIRHRLQRLALLLQNRVSNFTNGS